MSGHIRDETVTAAIKARLYAIDEVRVDSDGTRWFRVGDEDDPQPWISGGALAQNIEWHAAHAHDPQIGD